jgi:hypothetical protein
VGSIPDGVTGIVNCLNPSGRTMALRLTQTLNRNEYQEYLLGCKGGRYVGLTRLPPSCADCLGYPASLNNILESSGLVQACIDLYRPV